MKPSDISKQFTIAPITRELYIAVLQDNTNKFNGYINITAVFRELSASKDNSPKELTVSRFIRSKRAQDIIKRLNNNDLKLAVVENLADRTLQTTGEAVRKLPGVRRKAGDTEVHPVLAIAAAEWVSADFHMVALEILSQHAVADVNLTVELVERTKTMDELLLIETRTKSTIVRNIATEVMAECGAGQYGIIQATETVYTALFGGTSKKLRKEWGLACNANVRDHLTSEQLQRVIAIENEIVATLRKTESQGAEETIEMVTEVAADMARMYKRRDERARRVPIERALDF